jgi:hypothetical protein
MQSDGHPPTSDRTKSSVHPATNPSPHPVCSQLATARENREETRRDRWRCSRVHSPVRATIEPVHGGALWWPQEQTQGRLVNLLPGVRGRWDGGSDHGWDLRRLPRVTSTLSTDKRWRPGALRWWLQLARRRPDERQRPYEAYFPELNYVGSSEHRVKIRP